MIAKVKSLKKKRLGRDKTSNTCNSSLRRKEASVRILWTKLPLKTRPTSTRKRTIMTNCSKTI